MLCQDRAAFQCPWMASPCFPTMGLSLCLGSSRCTKHPVFDEGMDGGSGVLELSAICRSSGLHFVSGGLDAPEMSETVGGHNSSLNWRVSNDHRGSVCQCRKQHLPVWASTKIYQLIRQSLTVCLHIAQILVGSISIVVGVHAVPGSSFGAVCGF